MPSSSASLVGGLGLVDVPGEQQPAGRRASRAASAGTAGRSSRRALHLGEHGVGAGEVGTADSGPRSARNRACDPQHRVADPVGDRDRAFDVVDGLVAPVRRRERDVRACRSRRRRWRRRRVCRATSTASSGKLAPGPPFACGVVGARRARRGAGRGSASGRRRSRSSAAASDALGVVVADEAAADHGEAERGVGRGRRCRRAARRAAAASRSVSRYSGCAGLALGGAERGEELGALVFVGWRLLARGGRGPVGTSGSRRRARARRGRRHRRGGRSRGPCRGRRVGWRRPSGARARRASPRPRCSLAFRALRRCAGGRVDGGSG